MAVILNVPAWLDIINEVYNEPHLGLTAVGYYSRQCKKFRVNKCFEFTYIILKYFI